MIERLNTLKMFLSIMTTRGKYFLPRSGLETNAFVYQVLKENNRLESLRKNP